MIKYGNFLSDFEIEPDQYVVFRLSAGSLRVVLRDTENGKYLEIFSDDPIDVKPRSANMIRVTTEG